MRSYHSICVVLICAGLMPAITGCSDGGNGGSPSLEDSLASIEQARNDGRWTKPAPISEPPVIETGDEPKVGTFTVKVESSAGDYTIEVHRHWAPVGAERFYQLVKSGYYDECRYFRVVPRFMVQFGISGTPSVQKQWDRNIKDDPVTQSNKRGYVTFATSGANSRTTQIFINYADNSRLDSDGFAPFGHVIEGMENVDAINAEYREEPEQGGIERGGNAYLNQSFPRLDYVKKMSIVSETAE